MSLKVLEKSLNFVLSVCYEPCFSFSLPSLFLSFAPLLHSLPLEIGPTKIQLGGLGSSCSEVWGGVLTEIEYDAF